MQYGSTLEIRKRRKFKYDFVFFFQCVDDQTQNKAKFVMKEFLRDYWYLNELIRKYRLFYTTIRYIQKHMRAQLDTRYAKVEILTNYWEKLIINM